jgi:diguanylate cyclase (GGDEF)-like protein/PAS domain S-box-containing protein
MERVGARRRVAPVPLFGSVLGLLLLAVVGGAFIVASLALLAGGRAYVYGEGRWSKAQQETVFYLDRYAEGGDMADLVRARRALRVPLGDLDAREAMEAPELDRERAVAGLLRGQNEPEDIPKMIWMFRYFADAPHIRDAGAAWMASDEHILALAGLADELEKAWWSPPPDASAIAATRRDLGRIDRTLRPLETRFSQSLGEGMRRLEGAVAVLGALLLLALAAAALGLFRWATRRIRASERKFWASFEHAPLGMVLLSDDGVLQEVNDTACDILGRSRSALVGKRIAGLLHPEDRDRPALPVLPPAEGAREAVDVRFMRPDWTTLWGRLSVSRFPDNGLGTRSIAVLEDVSEAKALEEELSHQARHDPLTGLANRRAFERELDGALVDARDESTRHTLAFVDLDRFKRINDTSGHVAGDAALQEIARLMGEGLRTSDVLARLGGDEFGVILWRCPIDRGMALLDGVAGAISKYAFTWEGQTHTLGSSMGVVEIHGGTGDVASVMRAADRACYVAKSQGGGRVRGGAQGRSGDPTADEGLVS